MPILGVERVGRHGGQSLGVAQPVARQRLELEDEQGRQRGPFGLELGLALQDQEGLIHRRSGSVSFSAWPTTWAWNGVK